MGGAMVATIVFFLGLSAAGCYTVGQEAGAGAGDAAAAAYQPEDLHHRSYSRSLAPTGPAGPAYSPDSAGEHSVAPSASHPLQEAASSYQAFPLRQLQFSAGDGKSYGSHYAAYSSINDVPGNHGGLDSQEKITREYHNDPDFQNEQQFLDTSGYKQYKTATTFSLEGPHQLETIQSKSYHREVEPYDVGEFEHKHHEKEEHAEVHYHQHKHLHKHQHKQEHHHKHKQEHKHHHGHKHQHKQEHEHKHHHGHKHEHENHHHHKHQHEAKHQHHNHHKHDHHHGHKHEHSHHAEHKHEAHHGHKHEHHQDHKHDHHHGHKHDHHHSHKHHQDHKHEHKHHAHHNHHHGHEHKSHHSHHSHHKHQHKHHKYHHG